MMARIANFEIESDLKWFWADIHNLTETARNSDAVNDILSQFGDQIREVRRLITIAAQENLIEESQKTINVAQELLAELRGEES